jgi:arginase
MMIYFPQWQGAGASGRAIFEGAKRLRDHLGHECFEAIEPLDHAASPTENGIQNYRSLVNNLSAFQAQLDRTRPERVFTLGGDCSADIVPVSYLYGRYGGDMSLIWLDAHADVNTPASSPSGTLHGMPVRMLLGEGDDAIRAATAATLRPEDVLYVGVRELDAPEAAYLRQCGIRCASIDEVTRDPAQALVALLDDTRRRVYVHVDVDVLDPEDFVGVACPTPGGLDRNRLWATIQAIGRTHDIVGGSVLEFVGSDHDEIAYASAIFTMLSAGGGAP